MLQYFCSVSEQPIDPLQFEYSNTSKLALPDGLHVEINKASQLLPECFFNTPIYEIYKPKEGPESQQNLQFESIQYQFLHTVRDQPAQIRKELVQNIVLAGGVSGLSGLQTRLRAELDTVYAIQSLVGKPHFAQPQADRRDLAFFGGAVMASLSVFGYFVSSAQEWKEEGATGIERRRM